MLSTGNDPRHGAPRSTNSTLCPPPYSPSPLPRTLRGPVSMADELGWVGARAVKSNHPKFPAAALLSGSAGVPDRASGKLISGSPQGSTPALAFYYILCIMT